MIYKGKIGKGYLILIISIHLIMLYSIINAIVTSNRNEVIVTSFIYLTLAVFSLPPIFRNKVMIERNEILLKYGFLNKRYDILKIKTVYKTNDITSGYACSIDRIFIGFKDSNIMISLIENDEFIHQMLEINPNIKVV